jgi:hypothetical protein
MSARPRPASVPGGLLRRSRAGTSVSVLARKLGVSFDWVAQRAIAPGMRHDRPSRQIRRRPIELDSDEWLSAQLASGAGVRDLSRRLRVSRSTVRNALRDYEARRTESGAGGDPGETDPIHRFTAATERLERAGVALERARMLQSSAGPRAALLRAHDQRHRRPPRCPRAHRGNPAERGPDRRYSLSPTC